MMGAYYELSMSLLRMQMREAEEKADAEYLAQLLKVYPPEQHAEIRIRERQRIEKREADRIAERRHQEMVSAIRSVGHQHSWWF